MRIRYSAGLWGFALLLLLWGCGGQNQSDTVTGTLRVQMTDAAPCGYDKVNVTVSKLRIHQSSIAGENDMGWSEIDIVPPRKIELSSLVNGTLHDLGQTVLPAGHYTQLRLLLLPNTPSQPMNNSVVPTGGTETALFTPSAVQSGLKLIHEFTVPADTMVDLVLDFDACRSVVRTGNGKYLLKPVISVNPMVVSGGITGFVDLAHSNPVVYAEQGGQVVKSTIPNAMTGKFTLSPLQQSSTAGNYDVVITADGAATVMIQSVPVDAQLDKPVSTETDPITLMDSATTQTVTGAITPSDVSATIRATQTFTSGPTMEVLSVSAIGTYSLTLPAAPPMLGNFGPLPISFTADGAIGGKYELEISAEGYTSQTESVDISGGNATQDFALSP